jgi:hypothetical protein
MSESWEYIKEFYKEHFGTDKWVVEMFANMDILLLCVSGASNTTISSFLNIPIDEIKLVIEEVFEFKGWEVDLDINPYKDYKENLSDFTLMYGDSEIGSQLLSICETMSDIEERIDNEWI